MLNYKMWPICIACTKSAVEKVHKICGDDESVDDNDDDDAADDDDADLLMLGS